MDPWNLYIQWNLEYLSRPLYLLRQSHRLYLLRQSHLLYPLHLANQMHLSHQ
jgi:hypothetical protein